MSPSRAIATALQRYPALGALAYAAVVLACLVVSALSVAGVLDNRAGLAAQTSFLTQLQRRWPAAHRAATNAQANRGSPFIAGQTVTVAGSALMQRVSGEITRVGGRVLSSQVDLKAAQATPGFISVLVNCELDQPGLQKVLYDLEAGMPFLFIDQLEVHAAESTAHAEVPRMRVLLAASGQWLAKQ